MSAQTFTDGTADAAGAADPQQGASLPLAGVRVLDFSRIIAGPLCAQYLADLGAEVIKVERKGSGDDARSYVFPAMWEGTSTMYLSFNRGKRGIALDLSEAVDRAAALDLLGSADVLIENFRPGVMDRLGLGYEAMSSRNPGLIYCSISGFGDTGPLEQAGANDLVAQASCGLMSLNESGDGRPQKVVPAMVDMYTGVNAALAIVAALRQRDVRGAGTHITTSLFECGASLLSYFATSHFAGEGHTQSREEQEAGASITVPNQSFRASDGWMVIACSNDDMWDRLCGAMDRPDLLQRVEFATNLERTRHKDALVAILDTVFAARSRADWAKRLSTAKVSSSPVLSVGETLTHPQTQALDMVARLDHPEIENFRMMRAPFRYDHHRVMATSAPPLLGQHQKEVLPTLHGRSAHSSQFKGDKT